LVIQRKNVTPRRNGNGGKREKHDGKERENKRNANEWKMKEEERETKQREEM
jgi:hypothetical protein